MLAQRAEVAKTLIENGASVNAKDNQGRTALILATVKGRIQIVEILIKHKG